jgi:hypothetical protein
MAVLEHTDICENDDTENEEHCLEIDSIIPGYEVLKNKGRQLK